MGEIAKLLRSAGRILAKARCRLESYQKVHPENLAKEKIFDCRYDLLSGRERGKILELYAAAYKSAEHGKENEKECARAQFKFAELAMSIGDYEKAYKVIKKMNLDGLKCRFKSAFYSLYGSACLLLANHECAVKALIKDEAAKAKTEILEEVLAQKVAERMEALVKESADAFSKIRRKNAYVLGCLGIAYSVIDVRKSNAYLNKALSKRPSTELKALLLKCLGKNYLCLEKCIEAEKALKEGLKLMERLSEESFIKEKIECFRLLAYAYRSMNKPSLAEICEEAASKLEKQ